MRMTPAGFSRSSLKLAAKRTAHAACRRMRRNTDCLQSLSTRPELLFQCAVRTHVVDGARQMLRQFGEQLIDRQAKLGGQLSQMLIAERVLEVIDRARQGLAVAEP